MSASLFQSPLIQAALHVLWLVALLVAPFAAPGVWSAEDAVPAMQWIQAGSLVGCLILSSPLVSAAFLVAVDVCYLWRGAGEWGAIGVYIACAVLVVVLAGRGLLLARWVQHHSAVMQRLLGTALLLAALFSLLPLYFDAASPWSSFLLLPWTVLLWASLPRSGSLARDFLGKVSGALVFVVILLGFTELGARILFPDRPPNVTLAPHPERLVQLVPGAEKAFVVGELQTPPFRAQVSSQGLRDREYGQKGADEYRILAIGDSTTFGWGVSEEESFPKQLEALLREHCQGKQISVLNAGTPTFGPWQSLSWLREKAVAFQPDLVVYTLFPVNDVANELEREGRLLRSYDVEWQVARRRLARAAEWPMKLDHFLRVRSRAYQAVANARPHADGPAAAAAYRLRALQENVDLHLEAPETSYPDMELNRTTWYPELEQAVDMAVSRIADMRQYCEARGWTFVVGVLPSHVAVCQRDYDSIRWKCPVETVPFEDVKETRLIEQRLREMGTTVCSPFEEFRQRSQACDLHLPDDGHLSAEGNRLYAHLLAGLLSKLLPDFVHCKLDEALPEAN